MKSDKGRQNERKRRPALIVIALGITLGTVTGLALMSTVLAPATAISVAAKQTEPNHSDSSSSGASSNSPKSSSAPQPTSSSSKSKDGGKANNNGGSSEGSSNTDGSGGNAAPPAPQPAAATNCYVSRSENPSLWDACRAGYVAPRIEFGGLVSCTAIDRNAGTWSLRYRLQAVGGNWRGGWAAMTWNESGITQVTLVGISVGALSSQIPINAFGELDITPMNGLEGIIDVIEYDQDVMVVLSAVCS